jgi:hypothetical protein
MRRSIVIVTLALLFGLGMTVNSQAALYRGGGKGISVTFRVKGNKLIQADVVARLYCVGRYGGEQFDRIEQRYATPEDPLRLDRRGGFRWSTIGERQEEAFSQEEFLAGRVSAGSVMGKFGFFRSGGRRQTNCRTGSFPLDPGATAVRFRRCSGTGDRQADGGCVVVELAVTSGEDGSVDLADGVGGGGALGAARCFEEAVDAEAGLALAFGHHSVGDHYQAVADVEGGGALGGFGARAPP